jgi:hypothetical protein
MADPSFRCQNQNLLPEQVLQLPTREVAVQTSFLQHLVAAVGAHPLQEAQ